MSFIITFLAALFVFGAVIAIHEFGHFAVAKLCGVQVNEFSIGMAGLHSAGNISLAGELTPGRADTATGTIFSTGSAVWRNLLLG